MNTLDYIVNKYKITVGNQYLIDIPQIVGGEGLAHLFAELGFNWGVEIGTDQGEYAEVLCKTIPKLTLECIDPWSINAYESGEQPESKEKQDYFEKRYQETRDRLKSYHAVLIRKTSMEAVETFLDNSFDFVYIDGNHDFLNVAQDMHYWLKKVKPGGILSGHDYVRYKSNRFNHVQKVVNAYTQSYHMLPVFLTDSTDKGLRRDRFRSWFLVKPLVDPITHKPYESNNNKSL